MRATRTPAGQPLKHFAENQIDGHLVINPNTEAACAVLELSHDDLKLFYASDATCAVAQLTAYQLGNVAGVDNCWRGSGANLDNVAKSPSRPRWRIKSRVYTGLH